MVNVDVRADTDAVARTVADGADGESCTSAGSTATAPDGAESRTVTASRNPSMRTSTGVEAPGAMSPCSITT